ncbi:uncharacterized protein VTP21DRAFT_8094 [Calcarisporiella thermophila]|uniref:uncharacterized protein n=1 Tax=Calcarisporiella thermophila TaxID=911321 RepID=UPI00374373E9
MNYTLGDFTLHNLTRLLSAVPLSIFQLTETPTLDPLLHITSYIEDFSNQIGLDPLWCRIVMIMFVLWLTWGLLCALLEWAMRVIKVLLFLSVAALIVSLIVEEGKRADHKVNSSFRFH